MKKLPGLFIILLFLFSLAACDLQEFAEDTIAGQEQTVEAQVNATMTAISADTAPDPTPTRGTTSETGTIQGSLSYPSETLPAQHVVAFQEGSDAWFDTTTAPGQSTYALSGLPPGTYHVVAYLAEAASPEESLSLSGAYTQAVPCGLTAACSDHSLVPVTVRGGETVTGVDPTDWYAPPEVRSWPADPTLSDPTTLAGDGSISGNLAYPSEFIPAQHVVAFRIDEDSPSTYATLTEEGQSTYTIADLPPGTYHVVAYLAEAGSAEESLSLSAAYTRAVPCGLTAACTDHSLVDVPVGPGEDVTGIDPIDWYVPPEEKSWPPDPSLPESQNGNVTGIFGSLSYPSEVLPPQRVVAFDVNDPSAFYYTEVRDGQTYTLETPPGTYVVVSYLINPADLGATPGLAGGYSQAVLCGLQAGCDDHSLVPVEVVAGQMTVDVDPGDWYLPPRGSDWPSDPTVAEIGVISGNLGYPSEAIPPLRVVAFDVYSSYYYYVDTMANQSQYQISDLPVGTYHVVAFVRDTPDISGAYTHAVPCGLSVDCENHRLIDVKVYPGQTASGVDPVDFYVDPEEWNWPDDPTR
jgi:hypothetical protein